MNRETPREREAREAFEEAEREGPQEGDWVTTDHRDFYEVGGGSKGPAYRVLGDDDEPEPTEAQARHGLKGSRASMWAQLQRCMDKQKFYPNV